MGSIPTTTVTWLIPPIGSAKEPMNESPCSHGHCPEEGAAQKSPQLYLPHKDHVSGPCAQDTNGMTKHEKFSNMNNQESKGCSRPDFTF